MPSANDCLPALEKYRKSRQSSASSCLLGKHSALLRRADAFAGFTGIFQFIRRWADKFLSNTAFAVAIPPGEIPLYYSNKSLSIELFVKFVGIQ